MGSQATSLPENPPSSVGRLAIDAHVHFHGRQLVASTLDAAISNFRALDSADPAGGQGVLLLAQSAGERVFEWLREQPRVGDWSVAPVPAEPESLWLRGERGELVVVCGRQVIAEPGLEVMALGTDKRIEDGLGLAQTLEIARSANAIPVLPWGFGKWTGQRKQRIRALLASSAVSDLWVGDNGGRLRNLPRPRLLEEAEARGVGILPGTDPFPFGNDYRRVGSFGFRLEAVLDPSRPWQSIRAALGKLKRSPLPYGRGEGWLNFAFKQLWIQVDKRFSRRSV